MSATTSQTDVDAAEAGVATVEGAGSQQSAGRNAVGSNISSNVVSGAQIAAPTVNRNAIRPSRSQDKMQQQAGNSSARPASAFSIQTLRPTSATATTRLTKKPTVAEARKPILSLGAIMRCSSDVLSLILAQLNFTDFLSAIKINRQWNNLATLSTSWPQNTNISLDVMIARDCHFILNRYRYDWRMDSDDCILAQTSRCITIRFKKQKKLIGKSRLPVKPNILIASSPISPPVYYLSIPAPSSSSHRMLQYTSSVYLDFCSTREVQPNRDVNQLNEAFVCIRKLMPNLTQIKVSLSGYLNGGMSYPRPQAEEKMATYLITFLSQQPQLQWIELGGSLFNQIHIMARLINEISLNLPQLRVLHMHSAYSSLIEPEAISRFHALEYLKMDMTDLQPSMFDVIRRLSINHQLKSLSLTSSPWWDTLTQRQFCVLFEDPLISKRQFVCVAAKINPSSQSKFVLTHESASSLPYQPAALTRLHLNQADHQFINEILLNLPTLTDIHFESNGSPLPKGFVIPEWIKEFRVSGGAIQTKSDREDKKLPLLSEYFTVRQQVVGETTTADLAESHYAPLSNLEVFQIALHNSKEFDPSSFRCSNSILNQYINDSFSPSLHSLADLKLHGITLKDELTCLDRLIGLRKLSLLIRPQANLKYLIGPLSRLPAFHTLILHLRHNSFVSKKRRLPSIPLVPSFQLDTKELIEGILASSSWLTLRLHALDDHLESKRLMCLINAEHAQTETCTEVTPKMASASASKLRNISSVDISSASSSSSSLPLPPPRDLPRRLSSFRVNLTTAHPLDGGELVYGLRVKSSGNGSAMPSFPSSASASTSSQLEYEWQRLF